jgi:hypothetical protein
MSRNRRRKIGADLDTWCGVEASSSSHHHHHHVYIVKKKVRIERERFYTFSKTQATIVY